MTEVNRSLPEILKIEGLTSKDLFCTIHVIQDNSVATILSSHPQPEPLGSWQPLSAGVVGKAFETAKPWMELDVRDSPHYVEVYPGVRTEFAVPVRMAYRVACVVNFESSMPGSLRTDAEGFVKLAHEIGEKAVVSFREGLAVMVPQSELLTPERRIVSLQLEQVSDWLLSELAESPSDVYGLPPRRFEELVARLLEDRGYRATLTPEQKDGGFDLFAELDTPTGTMLTLVECKRYKKERPVDVTVVRNLLGVVTLEGASNGMVVTSSRFTGPAHELQQAAKYRISLRDFEDLRAWLGSYRNGGRVVR